MSFSALLRENQDLKARLADSEALNERLAGDLKLLREQVKRWLAGRGRGQLIAEGQEVLFPDRPAEDEQDETPEEDETPERAGEAPDGETQAEQRQASERAAPLPARALEGCAASANLLARILVQKYSSHLPLYRQEEIFGRDGLALPRQTMCDWVLRSAEVLFPIADRLLALIRAGPVSQLDDTPVKCQRGKGKTHFQAYLWSFINPQITAVAYRFTPGRASDLIAEQIEGVEGYLVGDGYSGNQAAARKVSGEITLAGCWAHTTRKFREARAEASATARLFGDDIKRLYAVEKEADKAGLDPPARLALRQRKSRPIVASLLARGRRLRREYSDAGKLGEAIRYMLNQRKPLRRFLEHGLVPIDSNACERSIRPIAVGRNHVEFAIMPS